MEKKYDFLMPAEWEKHERTFIEWPVQDALIHPENYEEVCKGYADVVKAIASFEPVTLLVRKEDMQCAETFCKDSAERLELPHNEGWVRHNGPTFVWNSKKELAGINWRFNAWGEKYKPYDLDDAVAASLLEHFKIASFDAPLVLEGGSIHTDGEGTLLSTKQCLLNPNRNPELSQAAIEEHLKHYLNVSKILWLDQGLYGDETDGHVDNIACFAKPGVVLLQTCYEEKDPNYAITQENLSRLQGAVDANGRTIKIVEIPHPPERFYKGTRLTLSYLNFYFVNNGIILPVFGQDASETDAQAQEILQALYPERRIKTVDGMSLIKEGGNVHCITQQMPLGMR